MAVNLYDEQKKAVERLKSGSILRGGVGTGKSRTALAFFYSKICKGKYARSGKTFEVISEEDAVPLYIITTAKKRDSKEWEAELANFMLSTEPGTGPVPVTVDSWNKIQSYTDVEGAFFIFDEQRLVGTGAWTKSFWKIAKKNRWIVLTATPGDNWLDYAPIFVANGYYKNMTQFRNLHVIYDRFSDYPKVRGYTRTERLEEIRTEVEVPMFVEKTSTQHHEWVKVGYDEELYNHVAKNYWNVYENVPVENASVMCYTLRKVVNSDPRRCVAVENIIERHPKAIIFYNFDYELEILRCFCEKVDIPFSEWNGHRHESLPIGKRWVYLVQYTAGAEGWNCTSTDTVIFYSQNYSWKVMEQSAGRIDRLNTKYTDLYYYHIFSDSDIDCRIKRATTKKKVFSESNFYRSLLSSRSE